MKVQGTTWIAAPWLAVGVNGDKRMREAFLDKLRVAATCAVVLLHTVTGVMDSADMSLYPTEYKIFQMILDLVCWSVPMFVIISGYLFLNPARQIGVGKMLKKYCRRIVLALFLFGVPYACMEQIALEGGFRWGMIGKAFVMVLKGQGWSHMWYLYLILILYLLTPALRYLLARIPRAVIWGAELVIFTGCSVLPWVSWVWGLELQPVLPDQVIYLFYYICGYLFVTGRQEGLFGKGGRTLRKKGIVMPGILLTGILLSAAGMVCSRLSGTYTVQMAYAYPFTALLALLLFGWGMTWPAQKEAQRTKAAGFWKQAAALSFTVYLVHPVFINVAYKALHVTPLSFAVGISLPLFFLGTLVLSAASAWILRRTAILRDYVL